MIIIKCDRCNREICKVNDGNVEQILGARGSMLVFEFQKSRMDVDLCEICKVELAEWITELEEEKEKKKRRETAARTAVKCMEDEEPKEAPKKAKGGRPKKQLDDGKVKALREAGWTLEDIADEMNCSKWTIAEHLKEMGIK